MTNYLYNQFISNENKALIWSLLTENNSFTNIPENKSSTIKNAFDNNITIIARNISSTDNLISLNKLIIGKTLTELKVYKTGEMNTIYNASELLQQRQKVFEDELNNKKYEFNQFNNISTPDKIDFSDILDSPIEGNDMAKIIEEQIRVREKQLTHVLDNQNKEDAKKWIQPGNEDKREEVKLKIGENINLYVDDNLIVNKPRKKVNFQDETILPDEKGDSNNFMALLKRNNSVKNENSSNALLQEPQGDMYKMLKEILDKQNQILDLLKK